MKLSEKVSFQDAKMIVRQTHDFTPVLEKSKAMHLAKNWEFGESRLVANIPMKLWHEWAKKWGVQPSDSAAMKEVVHKELMDPDNAHFRVWDGNLGRFNKGK